MSSGEPNQNSRGKLDLYAVASIIEALKEHGAMNKTSLATSTGIAYDRLGKYLDWLVMKGFISVDASSKGTNELISLSEEGLSAYEEFVKWILKYVERLRFPKISK